MELFNDLLLTLDRMHDTAEATRKNELQEVIRQLKNIATGINHDAVVTALENNEDTAVDLNDKLLDGLDKIHAELKKPADKQDVAPLFKDLADCFDRNEQATAAEVVKLRKAVEKLELKAEAPQVTVDVSKWAKGQDEIVKAVNGIKIPEVKIPKTDFTKVVEGLDKIYNRPIPVPQFPNRMVVTNPDGSPVSGGNTTVNGTAAYADSSDVAQKGLVDADRHVQVDVLTMPAITIPPTTQFDPTENYKITDTDTTGLTKYYGFMDKDSAWYILQENTTTGTYRYIKGTTGYSASWTGRAGLTYGYFGDIF